jgi:hypothetical protein
VRGSAEERLLEGTLARRAAQDVSAYWGDIEGQEPGWVAGAPTSPTDQSCAVCDSRDVVWVHPLASDLVRYEEYGKAKALPTFWTLCDRCEALYQSGGDDAVVAVMRSSDGWGWIATEHVAECVRKPLEVLRRADQGSRPLTG